MYARAQVCVYVCVCVCVRVSERTQERIPLVLRILLHAAKFVHHDHRLL